MKHSRRLTRLEREALKREIDRRVRERTGLVTPEHFLRDRLAAGPRDVGELLREAKTFGITAWMLRRTARRLGVVGGRDDSTWRLPALEEVGS